jgi:Major membrane immunogen, membrane-anchored lipoprotein
MKKIFLLAILLIAAYVSGQNNSQKTFPTDGIYTGESRSIYTDENYWGVATITIVNERITQLNFKIVDKNNVETFDEKYEKHFAGNDRYIQQCRNDYKGILAYTKKFREKYRLSEVDAISGATWSHNLFTDAIQIALNKAKRGEKK